MVYLDFEFGGTKEKDLDLVCCSTMVVDGDNIENKDWWLFRCPLAYEMLRYYLESHKEKIFLSWSVEAEARSMLALGLGVLQFSFVDLYIEYRMLQNHNDTLLYGKQLIDGEVIRTNKYGVKGKANLASATFKLLGILIDTELKDKMRNICIRCDADEVNANKEGLLKYCRSDIHLLPRLRRAMMKHYTLNIPPKELPKLSSEAKVRGNYSARTAKMVEVGYPVNVEWLNNFASNVPSVIEECVRDINSQFPEEQKPFRWNKPKQRFSMNQIIIKKWILSKHGRDWDLTKGKGISLALEAFTKKYHYAHEYPEGHLGAQMIRYLKLKQAMNGFNPNAEKNIFQSLGSDGRIRPYFNHYGAQSSRTQPASTQFIFLKPAWIRSMVQPPKGKAIGDYDWSSEEFFLSALMSRDKKMIEAYKTGDVYLAFGKMIGWIPKDGTKKSHKFERDVCKSLVLGLSYLMTKYGLARKLTDDTGRLFTEDQAQELVEQFEEAFQEFADWRNNLILDYEGSRHIKLECGWYMFGDNENFRSVGNVPIQGMGASVMRKAVCLAQDAGLTVIFTLHDAIYIEYDSGDFASLDTLKRCMDEAFVFYFEGEMKEHAKSIRVEGNTWSPDYENGTIITPNGDKVICSKIFVDPRSEEEYKLYEKYMREGLGDNYL